MVADGWMALQTFWSSFGLSAYDALTVPDDAAMPYITYESKLGDLEDKTALSASIWYRSTSWADVSQKAKQIQDAIGGGMSIPYSGGRLWVTQEVPFAQRLLEPSDDSVRRIVLQVSAEYH